MRCRRPIPSRGLTAIELLIAVAILSIMGAAMSAFALSLSTAWHKDEQRSALQAAAGQLSRRLNEQLVSTRFAAAGGTLETFVDPDFESAGVDVTIVQGTSLLLWTDDALSGGAGVPQAGEISLLEFDRGGSSIYLSRPIDLDQLGATAREVALLPVTLGELTGGSMEQFVRSQTIYRRELLMGTDSSGLSLAATPRPSTRVLVESAKFCVHSDASNRTRRVAYTVVLRRGEERRTVTGSIALRRPSERPA